MYHGNNLLAGPPISYFYLFVGAGHAPNIASQPSDHVGLFIGQDRSWVEEEEFKLIT